MQADTLAAVAASAAAVFSLINVAYQAHLEGRQENRRWLREALPEAVRRFSDAIFQMSREVFFKTEVWESLPLDERQERGLEHFAEAMQWQDRLDLLGSPELIRAALDVSRAVSDGHMYLMRFAGTPDYSLDTERNLYWTYAEAQHSFLTHARKELGLKPPPVPPGLARWREAHADPARQNASDEP